MASKKDRRVKSTIIIRKEEVVEGEAHGGSWKVAYADFVTAMMAFFLLMWLLNATTEDQRKGLADYFSPNNVMSHDSSGTGQPFGGTTAFNEGAMVSDRGSGAGHGRPAAGGRCTARTTSSDVVAAAAAAPRRRRRASAPISGGQPRSRRRTVEGRATGTGRPPAQPRPAAMQRQPTAAERGRNRKAREAGIRAGGAADPRRGAQRSRSWPNWHANWRST